MREVWARRRGGRSKCRLFVYYCCGVLGLVVAFWGRASPIRRRRARAASYNIAVVASELTFGATAHVGRVRGGRTAKQGETRRLACFLVSLPTASSNIFRLEDAAADRGYCATAVRVIVAKQQLSNCWSSARDRAQPARVTPEI